MSEPVKFPDGTPVASFQDVIEFLDQRAFLPCSSCGHTDWSVFSSMESNSGQAGFALAVLDLHTGLPLKQVNPVVLVTCKKCAYTRMHNFTKISKWAAEGKPEFSDEIRPNDG
jgi:predicted nucleic-acid-binding Zn-ribbon protein